MVDLDLFEAKKNKLILICGKLGYDPQEMWDAASEFEVVYLIETKMFVELWSMQCKTIAYTAAVKFCFHRPYWLHAVG